jgi:hypothetical protein
VFYFYGAIFVLPSGLGSIWALFFVFVGVVWFGYVFVLLFYFFAGGVFAPLALRGCCLSCMA